MAGAGSNCAVSRDRAGLLYGKHDEGGGGWLVSTGDRRFVHVDHAVLDQGERGSVAGDAQE